MCSGRAFGPALFRGERRFSQAACGKRCFRGLKRHLRRRVVYTRSCPWYNTPTIAECNERIEARLPRVSRVQGSRAVARRKGTIAEGGGRNLTRSRGQHPPDCRRTCGELSSRNARHARAPLGRLPRCGSFSFRGLQDGRASRVPKGSRRRRRTWQLNRFSAASPRR